MRLPVQPVHRPAFLLLFLCLTSVGIGQSMLFAILPPAAREIGISPFQVSTIFATSAFLWVLASPRWGRRSDLTGRRRIILTGLLGYATSMALLATVIALGMARWLTPVALYPLLVASRCIFALFGSGTGPAAHAYIADRTTRTERTAAVALVSAAMGLGETLGPGLGAALAPLGVLAPLYVSAGLAALSALAIWRFLPEEGTPAQSWAEPPRRMRPFDRRLRPFLAIVTVQQAVRATTVLVFGLFLQDFLSLDAARTVQGAGLAFVVLAASGLLSQLVLVQRFQPTATVMMRSGAVLLFVAFLLLSFGQDYPTFVLAMAVLGMGGGLLRPGASAATSLAVGANEQGAAAGLLGGLSVTGNAIGPMLGTLLYGVTPRGPFLLNAGLTLLVLAIVFTNRRVRDAAA